MTDQCTVDRWENVEMCKRLTVNATNQCRMRRAHISYAAAGGAGTRESAAHGQGGAKLQIEDCRLQITDWPCELAIGSMTDEGVTV